MIVRPLLLSCILAAMTAGLAATPAAAVDAEYDGFYGLIATTYGRGSWLVEVVDADQARVTTALKGLLASTEYRLTFSKARCGRSASPEKEVLGVNFSTDMAGGAYRAEVVPWLWSMSAPVPRSARLRPTDGGAGTCVRTDAFRPLAGMQTSEMQYSRFADGSRQGLTILDRLDGATGRLSWTFTGLSPGAAYRLAGATVGCRKSVTSANRLFAVEFQADAQGRAVGNQQIQIENDETHWVGSDRVRRIGGNEWSCRRASVTDLVIDPF